MEQLDQVVTLIALSMGVGWASGINLYAAIVMLGGMANFGHLSLPPGLELLADPLVLAAAGFMYCVEFFADKVPGVDTGWDTLHTFIRIPAGAVLAAGAMGEVNGVAMLAAGLIGGTMAATSHTLKAGSRVMINTSPEPVTNWLASFSEDVLVIAGLWTALNQPVLFLLALGAFILLVIWLIPKIWSGIQKVFRWLFGGSENDNKRLEHH